MEKELPFKEFIRKLDKVITYDIPEGYIEIKRNAKQNKKKEQHRQEPRRSKIKRLSLGMNTI